MYIKNCNERAINCKCHKKRYRQRDSSLSLLTRFDKHILKNPILC